MDELKDLLKHIEITKEIKDKSTLTKEEWKDWTKTVWSIANTSDKIHPAVFPVEIPYRLIRMFSFYGETVLDPFSGMANTGKAALSCNRNYIGFETNPSYQEISVTRLDETKNENEINEEGPKYKVINSSCKDMSMIPDNTIGTIVTSPPYWNKADYGDYNENIGSIEYYDEFLNSMQEVMKECYRVLKPGRRISIITASVNQNTREYGLLTFPIASDLTKKAQELGFVLINQIIWSKDGTGGKWGSSGKQRPIFGSYPHPPNFLFKNVHEYVVILQKPDPKKKNSQAPSYNDLFKNNY